MFDLNLQYVAQAERERRIESDLRRRDFLRAASATPTDGKPIRQWTGERCQPVGPVRAFGR